MMTMKNEDKLPKRLELKLKKAINNIIISGRDPEKITKPTKIFTKDNCRKILILRQDRIGDVLVTIPFIRILRKHFPTMQIDVILSSKNEGVSPAVTKYVNNIHIYQKDISSVISLKKRLRREHYDLVIDPFDNESTTSTVLIRIAKPRWSLGIDKENRKAYHYTVPLLDKKEYHIVDRISQLLLPFGIEPQKENKKLEYELNKEEKQNAENMLGKKTKPIRLGIILSGSTEKKFWGIRNNVKFIKSIAEKYNNIEFILFSTVENEEKLEIIDEQSPTEIAPFVDSVHEYAAMLSTCDILLTPDTSAVHFASAFNIPVICLYKIVPDHPAGTPWTPYETPHRKIITEDDTLKNIHFTKAVNEFQDLYEELNMDRI